MVHPSATESRTLPKSSERAFTSQCARNQCDLHGLGFSVTKPVYFTRESNRRPGGGQNHRPCKPAEGHLENHSAREHHNLAPHLARLTEPSYFSVSEHMEPPPGRPSKNTGLPNQQNDSSQASVLETILICMVSGFSVTKPLYLKRSTSPPW